MHAPRFLIAISCTAIGLVGCQPEPTVETLEGLANVEGGNPIVPDVGLYPFPSGLYEVASDTTATGRRLSFANAPLPQGIDAEVFAPMDGYSRIPQITTRLDEAYDPAGLPDDQDPSVSLTPESPVLLLNLDTGEPSAILAEPDLSGTTMDDRLLLIRPLKTLDADTHYGVLITDSLVSVDGVPLVANDAVRALRDGILTDSTPLEQQRADFELLKDTATDFGVEASRIVSGWTFHTRSDAQLSDPLLHMHDRMNSYSLGEITWVSDEDDGVNRAIRGEFSAPNFLNQDGEIDYDEQGLPIEQGTAMIPFLVTVPSSVTTNRPVVVYGHGFLAIWTKPSGPLSTLRCIDGR